MPQSQSSMGPTWTQFVPTMGQGNRYPALGAAQHLRLHRQAREAKLWVEV